MMTAFATAAMLLAATAGAAWMNARLFKAPVAVGLFVLGLVAALVLRGADYLFPQAGIGAEVEGFLAQANYPRLVLDVLLAYLLFAGAMNVNLSALARRGLAVALLATLGTVATAALAAGAFWGISLALGYAMPFAWALAFGVLISPTDPIAVLGMTKRVSLEPCLQAQIEGEALFNDGVAVVLFRVVLAFALAQAGAGAQDAAVGGLVWEVFREAAGGAAIGLALGFLAVAINHAVDDWAAETLVTVALATGVYALASQLHLSGPIGVATAGLIGATDLARRGHSEKTERYLRPFWHVVDEGLNALLFLLAGLMLFQYASAWEPRHLVLLALAPFIVLAARWIGIAGPSFAASGIGGKSRTVLITVTTWAGVRGALSLAMAFSLPENAFRPLILAGTFGVVIFSMVVQSMTMERLAIRTGYGLPKGGPDPTH